MANEDSVLREVDQELAEDQQWAMFRRYGPAIIGGGAAIIVGVGAWQVYDHLQTGAANRDAQAFSDAAKTLVDDKAQGRIALEAVAADSNSGYGILAKFRRASSFAADGERETAISIFQSVYSDGGAPKPLRQLARIRAGYLALGDGRDAALGHLGSLTNEDSAFRAYADEIAGLAALDAEDYETAYGLFDSLAESFTSPPGLAARATEFRALALSGKNGVNISGKFALDDIVGAVGADEPAAPSDEGLLGDLVAPAPSPEEPTDASTDAAETDATREDGSDQ